MDFGEVLAVALTLLVVLTTTHLEDTDLVVTTLGNYFHQNRCTCNQRSTKLDAVARANGENLVDLEVWTEDAEGKKTTPGTAVVALPSKK